MLDIKTYKQSELTLQVNKNYNPEVLKLGEWKLFLDVLCGNREYQKEAIINAIIYLASNRYKSIEDLITENYNQNINLQSKYTTLDEYKSNIQLPKKLFANIDLATGTGKSYVIYGIVQIMFGLGLIDKALVLCPSTTIESGLMEKFKMLSGDTHLRNTIPEGAKIRNPRIIDANRTIVKGDICIENIHAVYANTGSSIEDSLINKRERVLVLNDESHHIFNQLQGISGNTTEGKNIKKWKEFLLNPEYNFKYILGFTGTAYINNEYFNDVIYRYSLRQAIEDKIIKNIDYIQKDDTTNSLSEKFQKIYQNHQSNIKEYPLVKPLTILITKDVKKAKNLNEDLLDFLQEEEKITREDAEKKVLIVTSNAEHKANVFKLKNVDKKDDPIQWIISVSMLTEGWDVKNVFQIVPWEDRAFNSKLLIAQVLGRGLRLPEEYKIPQPKVIVFNHDSWSKNIKFLVDEVLEIETKITSCVLKEGERSKKNFYVYNLPYLRKETEINYKRKEKKFNYTNIEQEGIKLDSQIVNVKKDITYESVLDSNITKREYIINHKTESVRDVIDKIYEEFNIRNWEGSILQLGEELYTQNDLPPRERIEAIIRKSMNKVGIKGDELIEKNAQRIYQAFSTLLRKKDKTIIPTLISTQPYKIYTTNLEKETTGIGNFRRDSTVFFSSNYNNEIEDEAQLEILKTLNEDESLPRSAIKMINEYQFKTPLNFVVTKGIPEQKFVENLCKIDNSKLIESWIKSRDRGFYSIEYSLRYGGKYSKTRKYKLKSFNPDFFIKLKKFDQYIYYLIVEIKMDKDDCDENRAKYKYAKQHFKNLNDKLANLNIKQKYIFHFLSPNAYDEFFEYLRNKVLLESQEKFRCELENLLEEEN